MAEYCEDVENLVGTSSTVPAVDVHVPVVNTLACAMAVGYYPSQPVVNTVAFAEVIDQSYSANIVNTVGTTTIVAPTCRVRQIVEDEVVLEEALGFVFRPPGFVDSVAVTDPITLGRWVAELDSIAVATVFTQTKTGTMAAVDTVALATVATPGQLVAIVNSVALATTLTQNSAATRAVVDSLALADPISLSNSVAKAIEDVVGTQTTVANQAVTRVNVTDLVETMSEYWFRHPGQLGWQMNTETTALSLNTNFEFDSIGQLGSNVFGVAPDGIYLFGAANDDGIDIDAVMKTGFLQFDTSHIKHLLALYFGYRGKRLHLAIETYGREQLNREYTMPDRDLAAPAPNRIVTGKGTASRYWRLTFSNMDGEDFEVSEIEADVAESTRRL